MGYNFADDLAGAAKAIKGVGGALARTGGDLAALSPVGWSAGAIVDLARAASPDRIQRKWDRGLFKDEAGSRGQLEVGLKESFGSIKDLFADEKSATGGTISALGKGFHWWSEHVWLGGLETPMIKYHSGKTSNPLSWGEAYDASLQHSAADTLRMTTAVGLGVGSAVPAAGDMREIDFEKKSSVDLARERLETMGGLWNQSASVAGFALELSDPTLLLADKPVKGVKGAVDAHRETKGWGALAGSLDDAGNLIKGKIDDWDAAEIYEGLRFYKMPAGADLATALERSKTMEPQAAMQVREAVRKVLHGDVDGIDILAKHDPLAADQLKNAALGRATGGFDAALADDAAEAAGEVGYRTFHQPEIVATERSAAEQDAIYAEYVKRFIDPDHTQRMMLTREGDRALKRLHGVGAPPPERGLLSNGPNRAPVEFFSKGLRTIGWASGVTPTRKAVAGLTSHLSNSLRDPHVYGTVDTNDAQLVTAVTRHLMRTAKVDQRLAQQMISRVVTAGGPEARGQALLGAQRVAIHTMAKRHGVNSDLIDHMLAQSESDVRSLLTAVDGQIYSAAMVDGVRADSVVPRHIFIPGDDGAVALPLAERGQAMPMYATQALNKVPIHDLGRLEDWFVRDSHLGTVSKWFDNRRFAGDKTLASLNAKLAEAEATLTGESLVARQAELAAKISAREGELGGGVARTVIDNEFLGHVRMLLEHGNGFLKASMLLPRFPAYATRNLIEEELRASVTMEFFAVLNRARQHRKYLTPTGKVKGSGWFKGDTRRMALIDDEALHGMRAELEGIEFRIKGEDLADPALAGELARRDELNAMIAKRFDELGGNLLPSAQPFAVPGTNLVAQGAHEGPEGLTYESLVAGKGATVDLEGSFFGEKHFGLRQRLSDPRIPAPDSATLDDAVPRYYAEWADNLNRHQRADQLGRIALEAKAGGGDSDAIYSAVVDFLRSPQSREYRSHWPTRQWSTEQWAGSITADIDHYIPTPEMARKILDSPITGDELRVMFPVGDELLPKYVHQAGTSATMGASGRMRDRAIRWSFETLSRMSTDQLVRHPWFALHYEANLTKSAHALLGKGVNVTPEVLRSIESAARRSALHQFRRTFYQTGERSSAAHKLRFISPFFAAHQDSVRFWVKALGHNPEWLRRASVGYTSLSNSHVVTNQDGTPVEPGEFPSSDHVITIGFGGWKRELHPTSFLIMLQNGAITNPGYGQFAQMAMGFFQKRWGARSDTAKAAGEYINPYGPKDHIWEYFAPEVLRKGGEAIAAHMDDSWKNNNERLIKLWHTRVDDKVTDFKLENGRSPSNAQMRKMVNEAADEVKFVSFLRAAEAFAAPFQATPVSEHAAIIDEWYRMQDEGRKNHPDDPFWASEKWLDKYGSVYSALTYSPSSQKSGLGSTTQTGASIHRHKDLINDVDVSLAGLIVGPEGKNEKGEDADYNANTHRLIRQMVGNPATGTEAMVDEIYSAEMAAANAEYFREYNKLTLEAERKGLRGPEDDPELLQDKKFLSDYIEDRYPGWKDSSDFKKKERDFGRILPDLEKIATNKRLLSDSKRQDIRLLANYLNARNAVAAELKRRGELKKRGFKQYSGDIRTKANDQLRRDLADYVQYLKDEDTNFNEFVMRHVVSKDPLYDEDALTAVRADG